MNREDKTFKNRYYHSSKCTKINSLLEVHCKVTLKVYFHNTLLFIVNQILTVNCKAYTINIKIIYFHLE